MTTWTQIATSDAPSGGVFDFPSITFTGYIIVQIVMSGITVTSDDTAILFQFYTGGSLITSGYRWVVRHTSNATADGDNNASTTSIGLTSNDATEAVGNASGEEFNAILTLDAPLSSAFSQKLEYEVAFTTPAGSSSGGSGVGVMDNTGAIEGFKVSGSSSLTAGRVRVLGLA